MIRFMKKSPIILQRWIILTALACPLTTTQAQTPQAEKAFIKENIEFAIKQYSLMMQTPAQGKNGKG
ncbi:glycosyl hydrolase family 88, partial [Bacteroides thetaiotaomicron]|nr:glycosyl hydrolase family 88 [Bacteroides thetaiotaomicron]